MTVYDLPRVEFLFGAMPRCFETTAKTLRIEIVVQEDDGRTIVKTLEGEDAAKWSEMVASVCMLAEMRRANPDWGSLNWQKQELNKQSTT